VNLINSDKSQYQNGYGSKMGGLISKTRKRRLEDTYPPIRIELQTFASLSHSQPSNEAPPPANKKPESNSPTSSDLINARKTKYESTIALVDDPIKRNSGYFALLPDEIVVLLLTFLPKEDLARIAMVAKRFLFLLKDYHFLISWLHQQGIHIPGNDKQPFPAGYWLKLHSTINAKEISFDEASSSSQQIIPLEKHDMQQLEQDFCYASVYFWQQLKQAELALQQINKPDQINAILFKSGDILSLLLLHLYPTWNNNSLVESQDFLKKRHAFIKLLIANGLLPNYNNPMIRAQLMGKNLILFPFQPIQDGTIWHEAMQFLYQHEEFNDVRLLLSQAVEAHFKLLKQHSGKWTYAYLAAKLMTVSMSQPDDYGAAINYLSLAIEWLIPIMPSPFFADYAAGVGKLIFNMLVGLVDSTEFKPGIFRDFRSQPHNQVSSSQDAAVMVHNFIVLNQVPGQVRATTPTLETLSACMKQGYTLYQALKPALQPVREDEKVYDDLLQGMSFNL
jgi:hypothetical protein